MKSIKNPGNKTIKVIGGEYEYKKEGGTYSYLTDLGRSSLRFILRSLGSKRKFLLPDFLCKVIVDVFEELDIDIAFYHINEDLTIDKNSLRGLSVNSALYAIDYFGRQDPYLYEVDDKNMLIIEDAAFLPILEKPANIKNWIAFNTFRKISYIADGSIVKSTIKLNEDLIIGKKRRFPEMKYESKYMKYDYIHSDLFSEKKYLRISEKANQLIRKQREIYCPSKTSIFNMFNFYRNISKEVRIRTDHFRILGEYLKKWAIGINPIFPSFFVLMLNDRDELRRYLSKEKIFLPVHWPKVKGLKNVLYEKIISVPVDSRYSTDDMRKVASLISKFYK